jgi:hypothetical protein
MQVSPEVTAAACRTQYLIHGLAAVEIRPENDHLVIDGHGEVDVSVLADLAPDRADELKAVFKKMGVQVL